tara:strand:+ start:570 stop:851 length:282 start_codon:yes stop_codon:yes gene_type:complete
MAIMFGSLRHTYSGRKRKALPKASNYQKEFKPFEPKPVYRRETRQYKSVSAMAVPCIVVDRSYTKDANFTVAPAYNKGAYQVISRENIQDIGR